MDQSIEADSAPAPLRAPWTLTALSHGFFGRRGGASRGPFATLNLSYLVGDDSASVDENWRRALESMPPGPTVARLNQIHSATVRSVRADFSGERLVGDGLVTDAPGIMLTILTADCVPILMLDSERRVAAALHAGWRGTLGGIAGAGLRAMTALGAAPRRIRAALGPSIGPCCFEVDADLAEQFKRKLPWAARHTRPGRTGKAMLDLRGMIRDELEQCGLGPDAIADIGPCTRCAADHYFSRRAAGGTVTGLQLSFIGFAGREQP
jgi:polyphenol oxidase